MICTYYYYIIFLRVIAFGEIYDVLNYRHKIVTGINGLVARVRTRETHRNVEVGTSDLGWFKNSKFINTEKLYSYSEPIKIDVVCVRLCLNGFFSRLFCIYTRRA